MSDPAALNGNTDSGTTMSILSDVWDQNAHTLRMGGGSGALVVSKQMTYAGGVLNDPGDFDGTGTPYNLFTVTGQVLLAVIAVCSTTLTGASGTLSVGVTASTARFIPVTTGTTVTAGRTVDLTGLVTAGTAPNTTPNQAATNGQVIIGTTATADITAGVLTFYCFYRPISAGATVTAA